MRIEVTEYRVAHFMDMLRRFEKRASRRGIPFSYSILDPIAVPRGLDGEMEMKTPFEVSEAFAAISDWKVLGYKSVEDGSGLLVFGPEIPLEHRTDSMHCDHCHTNRRRNKVYVLGHSNGKEYMQVGNTCIDDFIGAPAGEADFYCDLMEEAEGFGRDISGGHYILHYDIEVYMSVAAKMVRDYGFVRNDPYCSSGPLSTKETVNSYFVALAKGCHMVEPTQADKDMAHKVIEWGRSLPPQTNDYMFNLASILSGDSISPKRTGGVACSAISAYLRAHREVVDGAKSEFLGAVGERLEFDCTVTRATSMDTEFGTSTLYMFRDAAGNVLKWFASGTCHTEESKKVHIKGTIKKHEEYKGVKQTTLTRCKILSQA